MVKVSANGTVALCSENDEIEGIVRIIDGHYALASVQVDGFVTMPYDTDHGDLVIGLTHLVVGATPDLVKYDATDGPDGPDHGTIKRSLVVSVNSTAHTVTFKL